MDYLLTKILLAIFFILITASYGHAVSGESSISDLKKPESSKVKVISKSKKPMDKGSARYIPASVNTESLAEHLRELYPNKEVNGILNVSKSIQPKKLFERPPTGIKNLIPVIDTESLARHLKELFPVNDDSSFITANSAYMPPIIEMIFGEEEGNGLLREIDIEKMEKHFNELKYLNNTKQW